MVVFDKMNPDNPFKNGKNKDTRTVQQVAKPEQGFDGNTPMFTNDKVSDGRGVGVEDWPSKHWGEIKDNLFKIDPQAIDDVAGKWREYVGILSTAFDTLDKKMKAVVAVGWQGTGADAALDASNKIVGSSKHLKESIKAMSDNLTYLGESVENARANMISDDEYYNTVKDKTYEALPLSKSFGGSTIRWDDNHPTRLQLMADECVRGVYDYWIHQMDMASWGVMTTHYDPGIITSDSSMPNFLGSKFEGTDQPAPPGPGAPGPGGTGKGGGGGGGGKTPTGALTKPSTNSPGIKPSSLNTPKVPGADGLKDAMSGLSGIGQNLAGQAQNLAKNLAGKQVPKPSPHLLNNRKNLANTGTKGKGGGGKGGGGAGKGGGAGGAKPTGAALREGLSKALKTASLGDRPLGTVSRASASPMMGGPMGGAGARGGGGGEDKVHKANKFLQTTANGEALLGVPLATVSSVLKAVPGDVKLAEVGAEASASKT